MTAETENSDSGKDANKNSTEKTNMDSSVKEKTKCFSSFKMFMVAIICSFMCKALLAILMKSSITHIERRFDIKTSEAGLIDGSFEIGNLLVITLVSHYGPKFHIPRLIGIGCFVMGIGSILTALPHFFMGYYTYDTSLDGKALDNSTVTYFPCTTDQHSAGNTTSPILLESSCKNESTSPMWIYVMLGNMLRGIGESPLGPLGIAYIDNFAKEGHSPFYIGLLQSLSLVGSILGFLLAALCARIYVDVGYVDLSLITINPSDSRWVGAWWLGFIIAGIISILSGVPFFFMPKSLKKSKMESKVPASLDNSNINDRNTQKLNFKNPDQKKDPQESSGYFRSLKCLLSNCMYLIYLVLSLLTFNALVGNLTYLPKYLEQGYGESISKSTLIFGIIMFPVTCISFFLGGFIARKFKLDIFGVTKLTFISQLCGYCIQLLILTLDCGNRPVAGLTVAYNGNGPGTDLQNMPFSFCNSDCNCDANVWDPVCGDDGLSYISPCLAGCEYSVGHGKDVVFHNCSCIEVNSFQSRNTSAHLGECSRIDDCSRKYIYYVVIQSLAYFFYGLGFTPGTMLVFKNVAPHLK
ncbi:solute carrier organic anion transporter family member 1B1-like [Trichosurus vulpecula]|uniref:solute carrier organic anion transporter family member 1B1-like n=1 Tax=Trichosurus vulpecula TaxID=9337 RepID=UPI00186B2B78|nr:solute carrier organic anion transporter family member 1B1-like [Trichosurus vulpecula]